MEITLCCVVLWRARNPPRSRHPTLLPHDMEQWNNILISTTYEWVNGTIAILRNTRGPSSEFFGKLGPFCNGGFISDAV